MDPLLAELASSSIHLTREMLPPVSQALPAYIDPGSGGLIVQLLVAGLIGGAFVARSYLARVGIRLRRLFSRGGAPRD
ncbi:MAG: hypothetical protein V3R87_08745 [Dehalococcoidia bacterium]